MKRFQFRLSSVQKLREATRDERRQTLAQAYEAERLLAEQRAALAAELVGLRKDAKSGSTPGQVNVDKLLDVHRYEMVLQAQTVAMQRQQGQLVEEIERRRQALFAADQEVRVLEKLRSRRLAEHQLQLQRLESKQLDEVASRRHAPGIQT